MRRTPSTSLIVPLLLLSSSLLMICKGCTPAFPAPSAVTSAQAAIGVGLQAIVPSYSFTCNGMIQRVIIRAFGDSGFVFQTWRPRGDGSYSLQESMSIPQSSQRNGEELSFNSSIPVLSGDTIGYRLEAVSQGKEEMRFLLVNTSADVVVYKRMTADVLCELSLCDLSTLNMMVTGLAPFISVDFVQQDENVAPLSEEDPQCTSMEVTPCAESDPPSSSSLPSPTPSTEDPATTEQPSSPEQEQEEEGEDNTLLNLNLTTETVIVLAVGIVLFLILIVLVVVLVACVCRKRKPTQYRFKSPTPGSNIGTPIAVASASTISTSHLTNGTTSSSDRYINSAIQTPLMNGTHNNGAVLDSSVDPLSSSDHRSRRMRSPLLPESPRGIPPAIPPKSHSKACSHSRQISKTSMDTPLPPSPSKSSLPLPSSSVSPHSESVLPIALPATVPPPAAIALQLASQAVTSAPSTSSITSHSPPPTSSTTLPLSHPPPPSSIATTTNSSETTDSPRATNNLVFVNSSSLPTARKPGHPYDHLTEKGKGEGITRPGVDPSSNPKLHNSNYVSTYVPTEEQRRLLKIQSTGRYEVTDEVEELKGYDRLKYFKESETYWSPATTTSGLYAQLYENKYRELPREQIIIQGQIGSGHFGSVSKGVWQLRGEGGEAVEGEGVQVAVKVVKTEAEEVQRVKLLQEAAIMGQFAHPNVVRLNGVVTVGDPTMIILEYMPQGDLKSYLQRMRPHVTKRPVPKDAPRLFIKFGKDIAAGMSYLARKNFIHRDLATRNILLSHNLTCKIGDFGMARDIAGSGGGSDYYKSHGGIIPVKWTAPESLNYNRYTSASDVWSYGMVLYEIWSLGCKPFHDLANPIVIALVTGKHCQAPPPGCPRPIYHLMVECWNPKDTQRPTFDCIQTYLDSPDSLLQWTPSDTLPGKQAHVLGAPLVEGNNLYIELQRTYQNQLLAQIQSSNS